MASWLQTFHNLSCTTLSCQDFQQKDLSASQEEDIWKSRQKIQSRINVLWRRFPEVESKNQRALVWNIAPPHPSLPQESSDMVGIGVGLRDASFPSTCGVRGWVHLIKSWRMEWPSCMSVALALFPSSSLTAGEKLKAEPRGPRNQDWQEKGSTIRG